MRASFALAFTLALASTMSTPVLAQDIGVPVCDKILKTYETCVMPNAPASSKDQIKSTFDQLRANWTAVVATEDGKNKLEKVCEKTTGFMKQFLSSYNCTW